LSEELERLVEERARELSKRLEEFRRRLEEDGTAKVKRAEREELIKKILEHVKGVEPVERGDH
jgi:hypothetical protein